MLLAAMVSEFRIEQAKQQRDWAFFERVLSPELKVQTLKRTLS